VSEAETVTRIAVTAAKLALIISGGRPGEIATDQDDTTWTVTVRGVEVARFDTFDSGGSVGIVGGFDVEALRSTGFAALADSVERVRIDRGSPGASA
jgi:hypothetical protein